MGYYISVEPGVNIFVEDINPSGRKAILFIHGWPANHKLYEYQFNILPAKGYRCIGIDIRGFGKSDKPYGGYFYDRLADDVRYIIEGLRLQNITLAGHSVGGAISTRYMGRHLGYGVERLVLIGAAAPSLTERPDFPYGLPKDSVTDLIKQVYVDRPKMLTEFTDMFFYQKISEPFSEWFLQLGFEAAGYATASVAAAFRDESLFSDIGKIQVPTLIMHGAHDRICLPPLAKALNKGIANSKLVWFENSGHGLFWEERNKFNKELVSFIE
ncbi:alpha/beta fold hydrolase [Cytobacillus sp. Hz8]|uniref:alpha/beta fold hydrolase n=1 Tax=Cytobacillus sp. Hz8 TaxID=3347168 RepID=UPI0035D7E30B